jgi:hypothetical protein
MNSKFKTLGLALVAALALTAVMASTASATTAVVTPGHHIEGLFGENNEGNNALTGTIAVECTNSEYHGTATTSTITLEPTLAGCHTSTGAPMTITTNGCAYKLTMGGPLSGMVAPVKHVEIECKTGKFIEVHIHGNAAHTIPACTINIPGQTPTVNDLTVIDTTNGTLDVEGTVQSITSTSSGHCVTTPPLSLTHDGPIPTPIPLNLHVDILLGSGIGLATQS